MSFLFTAGLKPCPFKAMSFLFTAGLKECPFTAGNNGESKQVHTVGNRMRIVWGIALLAAALSRCGFGQQTDIQTASNT